MSNKTSRVRFAGGRFASGLRHALIGALLTFTAGVASAQTVSQWPLSIANVPGNLLLVPSVEWPTLDSMANLGNYSTTRAYVGYFDPDKCYRYSYNATESLRHFYPEGPATNRQCDYSNEEWSGNYLNWATTQTIDPFRKALTGGYRVRDEPNETWLEKARYDGNGGNGIFPNRRLPAGTASNRALVQGATPADWDDITIRIWQLGNRMRFTRTGTITNNETPVTDYNPTVHTTLDAGTIYEVSVRVKVCDSTEELEDNCRQYSQGWKPEGLIQQYSERLRYSVFGYLNDGSATRDGGVLRARQKFVGSTKLDPVQGWIANANREWNPTTGVLRRNPDNTDASATATLVGTTTDGRTIADSGVINYINKFGQMTTANHKSNDPVSELFYTAIRYLKRQGNISTYTDLTGTTDQKFRFADGFPVITAWDDPMQYRCQSNALLGIGDTNTWYDKNLPGNEVDGSEPAAPGEVTADRTVNVVTATAKVAELEDIQINTPFNSATRSNSAYIAGLAYDSHTKDMRDDLTGVQTASTYWVDVREGGQIAGRASNQYWLAAKYGGFTVPEDFNPYAEDAAAPESSSWNSGEFLDTNSTYPRPRNFYVASEADKMVESLSRAFARIAGNAVGSGSALTSDSTRLEDDTQTFQAQFKGGTWSGELQAFDLGDDGSFAETPRWRASAALAAATWSDRQIYTFDPSGGGSGRYDLFTWDNLNADQKTALESEQVVDYLRGDRSREEERENGIFRTRTEVLGDIVNSSPVYVGKPNPTLYAAATFEGANEYAAFVTAQANRTPAVYVGANDGMLHGFNAGTGAELYAFVPNAAIMNDLHAYSDVDYDHRYFVDGEIAIADVYDGNDWKTVLVGTMGRGGPGVFALDVTNPTDVRFLWEKSGADIPALGQNLGRPVIAQVDDGDWRVILGNGPGSASATAQLVMIGIPSGAVTVVTTGVTGSNGLTAVLARSNDGDRFAETAYAGDLRGNLWKFSGLGGTPSVSKMLEARDPLGAEQPFTAAPTASKDPETGITWVFAGTGRYLGGNDPIDRQVQTWYGIKDSGTGTRGRGDLVQRDILEEGRIGGFGVRVIEEGTAAELVGQQGWFMDLLSPTAGAQGERMVLPNRFHGDVLIGTTRIPNSSDACQPSGRSWIMALNPFTGSRLPETFFDVTGDGEFTEADMLNGDIVSGIMVDPGLSGNPNVVGNTIQYGTDDGGKGKVDVNGGATEAGRLSWRELVN